ncbi:MAG: asparagine synthase (glutamine-hydrolyzing) [Cyanobacteria bacterium P01_A01_bin.116]
MCGIAGIVGQGSQSEESIMRMLHALRYRGPDDEDVHLSEGVALGQRRLSIIDLAGGRQPIPNEDQSLWVICNGEIYNYKAIKKDLEAKGHRFSTGSDSEVVVHLYEEYGEKCVDHLRGMFAFAVWDEKNQRLFAARDHLGQKPFFYVHREDETFTFASEIKSLLAFDPSLAEMDLQSLDQYLSLRIIAPPRTMFQSIRKLPPGHCLSFSKASGLRIERYWDLSFEPKHSGSDDELVDALEEQLIESLKLHMVSDVPVGAFVSGGLDSTLIVAMLMKHVVSDPIKTFSVGLPYGGFDEAPYARIIAEQYGTDHYEKTIVPSLVDTLPQLVFHLDEPSDPLSICSYLISEMAREHVKVVLGGDGGDELFGGYDRYYGNLYAGYYAKVPSPLRKYVMGPVLGAMPDGKWYKSRSHQLKWLHKMSFMKGSDRYAASLGYFYFDGVYKASLYGDAMKENFELFDAGACLRDPFERIDAKSPVDRMLYADSQVRLPDHSVMILDRMSMAHGLEARSPFMDHKIAEFSAQLPMRMKVRGRSLRYIQKRLGERYLPPEIMNRPKQGFSSALPYLLKDEYPILFKLFLEDSHLSRDGVLRQSGIDQLLAEHQSGQFDHGNRLWLLLNSEVWYRMFIDGQSAEDLTGELQEAKAAWSANNQSSYKDKAAAPV